MRLREQANCHARHTVHVRVGVAAVVVSSGDFGRTSSIVGYEVVRQSVRVFRTDHTEAGAGAR